MVKKMILYDKLYNIKSEKTKNDFIIKYLKYLRENIKGFPNTKINFKKLRDYDKRFEIFISGPEEIFVYNLLKKEIGILNNFEDVKVGDVYKGTMVDVGKVGFGIFVDCAIANPETDVLVNLHSFRDQLCGGKEKAIRDIMRAYNFIDHFPVYVKILDIDLEKNKIKGELDKKTLNIFKKIIDENIEGIFLSGQTKGQFKKALIRKGHLRDIISLERYGFLEHIAVLKEDSNAPGIISNIGNDLRNCKLRALIPEKMKSLLT